MPRIGVQAMMLKDDFAEQGPFEVLRRVAGIGYRAVEVSQIPMTAANVAELARARDELGIEVAALSASLDPAGAGGNDSLVERLEKIVADATAVGARMVRIGMLPFAAMADHDTLLDFADRTDRYAQELAGRGIRLSYHNHHIEFARFDGRHLLDVLADRAPHVGLEIDVHWVARGGLDPVRTLQRYAGRVELVHLKDYRIALLTDEDLRAIAAGAPGAFVANVQFAEVGEGNLDFPAIIRTATDIGAAYLLVEQDERYGRTALECLQTSYDNLVGMGFAHLF